MTVTDIPHPSRERRLAQPRESVTAVSDNSLPLTEFSKALFHAILRRQREQRAVPAKIVQPASMQFVRASNGGMVNVARITAISVLPGGRTKIVARLHRYKLKFVLLECEAEHAQGVVDMVAALLADGEKIVDVVEVLGAVRFEAEQEVVDLSEGPQ